MVLNVSQIEVLMAEKGMNTAALSGNSGISRQNVSTILRRGTATPPTVGKIARGLGVPVTDIIKEV